MKRLDEHDTDATYASIVAWTLFIINVVVVVLGAVAVAYLLSSCARGYPAPPEPTKYTLVVDSSFTVEEAQSIVAAADDWAGQVEDITWTVLVIDRASIDKELETIPPIGTYYVIRVDTAASIPVECAVLEQFASCYNASRIYIAEADLQATYNNFRRVTGHGLGHAWEMGHSTGAYSIMDPQLATMAPLPQHIDVVTYCEIRGCPYHKKLHSGVY
jgi:hypothetical protein